MSIHFRTEVEKLHKMLLGLSALVEDNLERAFLAIERNDRDIAAQILRADEKVDRMEVEIEEECLKILALHQPVAVDLRVIIAVLKINNDLERIGDHAVNITDKIPILQEGRERFAAPDLSTIFEKSIRMLKMSIDAFINLDSARARAVCAMDEEVDDIKRRINQQALQYIQAKPAEARYILAVMGVARNLERVADLATNIAEDVVYMIEGAIIRHGSQTPPSPKP
ncbi:MAG: phosphate signaling complex protein PhoU [Planctomycetota bacterium]|nr:phosphate signaling complex protein PhoU [Planctomycetota bacterium]